MNDLPEDLDLIDGRYRLDVELGAGAFGAVYKAVQIVLDQPMREVALKLFHGGRISPENVKTMMNDAVQILAVLSRLTDWEIRQHFVTVYDLGITRERTRRAYIAMELVRGGNLEHRIRDFRKFTLQATHHYMLQIARALAFMHANGFVHSDLKPANVLVFRGRDRDLVKIGDFGLAGRYEGLFGAGPKGGTLSYTAGEVLQGVATSPAADVFSMGLIAYEMLTGRNPYNDVGSTLDRAGPSYENDLRAMQVAAREEPLSLVAADFPELTARESPLQKYRPLIEVINKMLLSDVCRRYQSAENVLADLEQIELGRKPTLDGGTAPGTPTSPDEPTQSLREEFRYYLNSEEWSEATRVGAAIIRQAPTQAESYILASMVPRKQALRLAQASHADNRSPRLYDQAIKILNRGLTACEDSRQQRRLRLEIADVYERRGDSEMAAQSRRLAQQS